MKNHFILENATINTANSPVSVILFTGQIVLCESHANGSLITLTNGSKISTLLSLKDLEKKFTPTI
jgi:hypothetical protein